MESISVFFCVAHQAEIPAWNIDSGESLFDMSFEIKLFKDCEIRSEVVKIWVVVSNIVWPSSEELGGLGVCKAQGAEGQGAKHLQKARQFLEHRLHAAVIKLAEEQHKQAIAHDDEQAKGALVDKEGPDHSGCDSGQSRKRRKTALSSDYNPCILKAEAAGGQPRCVLAVSWWFGDGGGSVGNLVTGHMCLG